jgi:branched-chain amino acid transport system substrate-binding protein
VQGPNLFRILLLLLACMWLAACGASPTPTPIVVEIPVEVPVEVTRLVTQQVTQQILTPATPTPSSPCAASDPGAGEAVTIGAILPLSSPGAILAGFAMQTALNIAVSDINEHGGVNGIPIRLVTYDSAGTAERSAQYAERLILLDCAVGIVGLYHNADAMAAIEVAHHYGVPIIVAEAGADDITATGYPEVFRIAPSYSMLAQVPAQWLSEVGDFNGDGVVAAVLIAGNTNSGTSLLEAMRQNMVDATIRVEVLHVDLPSSDFSSVVARLVTHEQLPDAVFIAIKGEAALRLQSQLLEAGIGPQRSTLIVQNHAGLDSAQFWSQVPNGNGTIVLRLGAWASTLSERGHDFVLKYDQYMARWPESYAYSSYDALWLLANALRDAPTWQGSDLITTLEQNEYTLTSGVITFTHSLSSSTGIALPAYRWHQWTDSQVLYLQYTEPNQLSSSMPVIWPPRYRDPALQTAIIPTSP